MPVLLHIKNSQENFRWAFPTAAEGTDRDEQLSNPKNLWGKNLPSKGNLGRYSVKTALRMESVSELFLLNAILRTGKSNGGFRKGGFPITNLFSNPTSQ